ncbi:MAG TPA: glycosyltransferase, partial [Acidobacteriota bacterium]|nr:glycosyltransferase [Acidobacteriota bacterium]
MLHLLFGLIALAFVEALLSVRAGVRFQSSFQKAARTPPRSGRLAPASLIVPCRGVDPGLKENLEAFLQQDFPDYQVLFAVDSHNDSSVEVIEEARRRFPKTPSLMIVSGTAQGRSQKVQSQLRALEFLRSDDEAIAFGDSDIRPHREWLVDLVSPLSDSAVGVSTGFRWYVPVRGNFTSVLRSVWNAGIASLLTGRDVRFAWGGAMAIRRKAFESARVRDYWRNALSDDFAMTRAVRDAGLRIRFEPRCLSFSYEDCSMSELLEWSFRQLAITRAYDPGLWRLAFSTQSLNFIALWGGLAAG